MIDIQSASKKISRSRKSCITDEQRMNQRNFQRLYRIKYEEYQNKVSKDVMTDFILFLIVWSSVGVGIALVLMAVANKLID